MVMKKGRGEVQGIVKLALLATVLMIGLTPLANAGISITITPEECNACLMTTYTVQVTSDELWTWQNTTIPKGLTVVPPTPGQQMVRTDFTDGSTEGFVILTANATDPETKIDVYANIDGFIASNTQDITYEPGQCFTITSPYNPGSMNLMDVCWMTDTSDGYANVSVPGLPLLNITDEYTLQLCCPEPGAVSTFYASTSSNPDPVSDSIVCSAQVPVYNTLGVATLVGIMSVVLGVATMRRKK